MKETQFDEICGTVSELSHAAKATVKHTGPQTIAFLFAPGCRNERTATATEARTPHIAEDFTDQTHGDGSKERSHFRYLSNKNVTVDGKLYRITSSKPTQYWR